MGATRTLELVAGGGHGERYQAQADALHGSPDDQQVQSGG